MQFVLSYLNVQNGQPPFCLKLEKIHYQTVLTDFRGGYEEEESIFHS